STGRFSNRLQPVLASLPSGHNPVPIPPLCLSRTPSSTRGKRRSKERLLSNAGQSPWSKSSNCWCSETVRFDALRDMRLRPSAADEIRATAAERRHKPDQYVARYNRKRRSWLSGRSLRGFVPLG